MLERVRTLPDVGAALVAAALVGLGALVFWQVGRDYQRRGKLTPLSSTLEVVIFFLHGSASYVFLDSRLSAINTRSPVFALAVVCMAGGLALVAAAMGRLGMPKSLGRNVTGLRQTGLYRYTRNPQIVAYALVVIGYALLWPSWWGLAWVGVYLVIGHLMVRTEEAHLRRVYGDAYRRYCERTPRYLGLPNRN